MATYCGVDFHARQQTITWCDSTTGELKRTQLNHQAPAVVRALYAQLAPPVIVGFETSGRTYAVRLNGSSSGDCLGTS
jgi:hypothetical protein